MFSIKKEYVHAYANDTASCTAAFGCMDCLDACAETYSHRSKENFGI